MSQWARSPLALMDSCKDYIPVIMDLIIEVSLQYQIDKSDVILDRSYFWDLTEALIQKELYCPAAAVLDFQHVIF